MIDRNLIYAFFPKEIQDKGIIREILLNNIDFYKKNFENIFFLTNEIVYDLLEGINIDCNIEKIENNSVELVLKKIIEINKNNKYNQFYMISKLSLPILNNDFLEIEDKELKNDLIKILPYEELYLINIDLIEKVLKNFNKKDTFFINLKNNSENYYEYELYKSKEIKKYIERASNDNIHFLNEIYNKLKETEFEEEKLKKYIKENPYFDCITPSHIGIEIINKGKDYFYPEIDIQREQPTMDLETFKKIIDNIEGLKRKNCSEIDIIGIPDPFENPNLIDMLAYAKQKEVDVTIYTTGEKIDEPTADRLIELGVDCIFFKLDATTNETYKRLGRRVNLEQIEKIIKYISDRKKTVELTDGEKSYPAKIKKPVIAVEFNRCKENEKELEDFWKKWTIKDQLYKKLGYKAKNQQLQHSADSAEELEKKTVELEKSFWPEFYKQSDLLVEFAVIKSLNEYCGKSDKKRIVDYTPLKRYVCRQLAKEMFILSDGSFSLCRQDIAPDNKIGNIKEINILDAYKKIKNQFLNKHIKEEYESIDLCAKCKEWYYGYM